MWHDNETTVDYLNFGVVADACANLLQQANGYPLSIGVLGGWGVGKRGEASGGHPRVTESPQIR